MGNMSSSQSHEILVDAILWDMDGTLINSTPAADKTYQLFCEKHNIDQSGHPHGVRMVDSMRKWFPKASDAEITDMAMQFEADIIQVAKDAVKAGQPGIVILPGVERILDELRSHPSAEQHYAICAMSRNPAHLVLALSSSHTCTSHTRQQLEGLGAHHIVENL